MVRHTASVAATAFSGAPDPANFFAGPPQEEALARLEWLATEGQRCGLIVGATGCGKSHLAVTAARRLAGLGAEVAVLSLRGLTAEDWLEMLLERLDGKIKTDFATARRLFTLICVLHIRG